MLRRGNKWMDSIAVIFRRSPRSFPWGLLKRSAGERWNQMTLRPSAQSTPMEVTLALFPGRFDIVTEIQS
jgi:hypothetical protein